MSLSTTPVPARTDGRQDAPQTVPAHSAPASTRFVRRAGIAVTGGTAAWAAGISPSASTRSTAGRG
jgi:hypothetical protein